MVLFSFQSWSSISNQLEVWSIKFPTLVLCLLDLGAVKVVRKMSSVIKVIGFKISNRVRVVCLQKYCHINSKVFAETMLRKNLNIHIITLHFSNSLLRKWITFPVHILFPVTWGRHTTITVRTILKNTTDTIKSTSHTDFHSEIKIGKLSTKLYDKVDDVDFLIVNQPFL